MQHQNSLGSTISNKTILSSFNSGSESELENNVVTSSKVGSREVTFNPSVDKMNAGQTQEGLQTKGSDDNSPTSHNYDHQAAVSMNRYLSTPIPDSSIAATSAAGGHSLTRAVTSSPAYGNQGSMSPKMSISRGDRKAVKKGTLEEATAVLQVYDEDAQGIVGFDPRQWIVAAGVLEKKRNGAFREGWSRRWFVLDGSTLYYFLLPKDDLRGMCPLLGDERGQIKMSEVQNITNGATIGDDECVIHMTVQQIKKVGKLPLPSQVTEISLRASSPEAGRLWTAALQRSSLSSKRREKMADTPLRGRNDQVSLSPETNTRKGSFGVIQTNAISLDSNTNTGNFRSRGVSDQSTGSNPISHLHFSSTGNNMTIPEEAYDDALDTTPQVKTKKSDDKTSLVKVTESELSKLAPKLSQAKHLKPVHMISIIVLVNAICFTGAALSDPLIWFAVNIVATAIIVLFERQALAHDSAISIANRTIYDLHQEIASAGLNPTGRLARQASSTREMISNDIKRVDSINRDDDDAKSFSSLDPALNHNESTPVLVPSTLPSFATADNLSPTLKSADALPDISSSTAILPPLPPQKHLWTAGTNMKRIESDSSSPNASMSWFNPKGERFKLRIGPNYKANGKKGPSADPFYELLAMDVVRSNDIIYHIGSRVNLPRPRPGVDDLQAIKQSGLPRLFIVNAQIPEKAPSLWGSNPDDPGVSVVFYFTVKPETVQAINKNQATPALKLLHQFVTQDHDDIRRRFKGIGFADNITELGIPGAGLVEKFNGELTSFLSLLLI